MMTLDIRLLRSLAAPYKVVVKPEDAEVTFTPLMYTLACAY